MKTVYIKDLLNRDIKNAELYAWVKSIRNMSNVTFIDLADSTGQIQVLISKTSFSSSAKINPEACIKTSLILKDNDYWVNKIEIIGDCKIKMSPRPRSNFNISDPKYTEELLSKRHLFIRNEKVMAILKYRHQMMGEVHKWFRENGFTEITAPILTRLPLYDNDSVMTVNIKNMSDTTYLTQCVGFYLESAVAAFEKVYNIGPSFRGEESRSKRHLMEYWHIKAEIAFANLEDGRGIVEAMIKHLIENLLEEGREIIDTLGTKPAIEGLKIPFPVITYREAVKMLNENGHEFRFGRSLSSLEETILSRSFKTPFWVAGIPRTLEPFPYKINKEDPETMMVSDLIASNGYGELLGVAEKIENMEELEERMKEKGKWEIEDYSWVKELRDYGNFPHIGFGMGVERFIRWALGIEHVRDAIPFPRTFRRKIYP